MPGAPSHATSSAAAPDPWAQHYATSAGYRFWPCEELVRAIGGRRFDTVLEVGCGNGANLWYLAERSRRVIGIDFLPSAVAAAVDYMTVRDVANVSVLQGDLSQPLNFADASVDAVIDAMVSQHFRMRDHDALFREYRRVLKPGGWFFLYHLAEGTTIAGRGALIDAFTRSEVALFPEAGRICIPPVWALTEKMTQAGFAVGRPRGLTRWYPDGATAQYAVIEGVAQ